MVVLDVSARVLEHVTLDAVVQGLRGRHHLLTKNILGQQLACSARGRGVDFRTVQQYVCMNMFVCLGVFYVCL
jgi:hypothetical protein